MVVSQNHSGCVVCERFLDDFARMDRRSVNRAAKKFRIFDDAISIIEIENRKDFV